MTDHESSPERIQRLRRGSSPGRIGFVASVPWPIEAGWNPRYAHLAGFPVNLVYAGLRAPADAGPARPVSSSYVFDPGSYREDETSRRLDYFSREASPYWVRVSTRKEAPGLEVTKYRGETVVALCAGADSDGAMIQATLVGLAPDEPESPETGGQP